MGNELRFRSVMDDKTSGSLDKMRKKFDDLRKAGTQGIVIGASAAVTAKAIDGITNAAFRAGQAIGDFVSGSIQDASKLPQSVGAVESVFGNMAGRITDFGNEAADAIGLSRREVNEPPSRRRSTS